MFRTMRSSLVLCVLLGLVLSVRAPAVPLAFTSESVTPTNIVTWVQETTNEILTTPYFIPYVTPNSTLMPDMTMPVTMQNTDTYPPNPGPSQIMCPDGWEVYRGRCYYFVNEGMTWTQAQSNCACLDSMLVSVHSVQEYGFLQQLTNNNGNQQAWLGGFFLQDQWVWLDGSWFYNNWSNESPDSSNPCLLLISNEEWTNDQCKFDSFASICVKNSNVPQSMVCPEGWIGFQGRCYYYNQESLSWTDADTTCAGLEASLVSVHSPQEYLFLYQQTAINGFSPTWLGGFYLEDQWVWLDGSWFYQGFFTEMSQDSTNPCLSTYSPAGWTNFDCDQNYPSFCVKNENV